MLESTHSSLVGRPAGPERALPERIGASGQIWDQGGKRRLGRDVVPCKRIGSRVSGLEGLWRLGRREGECGGGVWLDLRRRGVEWAGLGLRAGLRGGKISGEGVGGLVGLGGGERGSICELRGLGGGLGHGGLAKGVC